ncbi:hypothetical protein WT27_14720 [Burkholderia territorii]|uniref:Uncharacterized protein n=1 Tax=Burkholderia territorii TaxID=1503055 RepID=A0A119ANA2_9BURK|nr:hypothetical protein WT27_14720 [Burkholderia territorii]
MLPNRVAHRSTSTSTRTPAYVRVGIAEGSVIQSCCAIVSTAAIDRFAPRPLRSFCQAAIRSAIASPTSCVPA